MNDFEECLRRSHEASDWPGWEGIYRKAFSQFAAMIDHRNDGYWQRAGIDRTVVLTSSKTIRIDEKVRDRNKKTGLVYDDIALEYISNHRSGTPGWVCKPLQADYIAYAIRPLGICHLLPVEQMQQAFAVHRSEWIAKHPKVSAENLGYVTISVAVPPQVLYRAIGECLRVRFEPLDVDYEAA